MEDNMRFRHIAILVASTSLLAFLSSPAYADHFYYHEHPHYYRVMPPGYKTVIVAGATYFLLDNLWYMMHGDRYEQVAAPTNVTVINNPPVIANPPVIVNRPVGNAAMTVIDVNGFRYYLREGHYYRRDINGQYLEVTPPM
jgi:hypothetical protein